MRVLEVSADGPKLLANQVMVNVTITRMDVVNKRMRRAKVASVVIAWLVAMIARIAGVKFEIEIKAATS